MCGEEGIGRGEWLVGEGGGAEDWVLPLSLYQQVPKQQPDNTVHDSPSLPTSVLN